MDQAGELNHQDLIFVNIIQLVYFSGYAVPLTLLIGWHPQNAFLWFLVVEAIISFIVYWVRIYIQSRDTETHDKCKRSRIVTSIGAGLVFADTWATVVLGILLHTYWTDLTESSDGHSTILLIIACISKVLYKTLNDVCILRSIFEHNIHKAETETTAAKITSVPNPQSALKTPHIQKTIGSQSRLDIDMGCTM